MGKFNVKTIDDINVKSQTVLVRCDYNVPLVNGEITDDTRIKATLPTLKKLLKDGGKLVLCSHLGKAGGVPNPELSLAPVAKRLSTLLKKNVKFLPDDKVVSEAVKDQISKMNDGDVVLLENLRFRIEEENNDDNFSKELGSLCSVYVNDAFGTAHRAHASTYGVAKYVKTCVAGYLLEKEVSVLGMLLEKPARPFVGILGGAKIKDKLKIIDNLLDHCDSLIIGGGMAYTFLKALGYEVGTSLLDESKIDYCKQMLEKAKKLKKKILLPVDSVATVDFPNPIDAKVSTKTFNFENFDKNYMGLDIGRESIKLFMKELRKAKCVVWNGPMGLFENPSFRLGSYCIARQLSELKNAKTIIGGGDSVSAVSMAKVTDKMYHISTGGGATLTFLEGTELPGIKCLNKK